MYMNLLSQDKPWLVTPFKASRQTLQNVGRACEQMINVCISFKKEIFFFKFKKFYDKVHRQRKNIVQELTKVF